MIFTKGYKRIVLLEGVYGSGKLARFKRLAELFQGPIIINGAEDNTPIIEQLTRIRRNILFEKYAIVAQ